MKNGTSMDHFHCTKFSKLWHHCKKKQKKNFWNLYFQECWCEFYPSIWPIELCIWNVWSLNLTGPFDLQQSKQQYRLVQSAKSQNFLGDFNPPFHIPASKSHTYLTIKSSIYFLHCLTKRPVERKLLSSQIEDGMAAYFWKEDSTSDSLVLANFNACNNTSMSQPGRVDTKRKLQTTVIET